jgi:hypothetical protein
MMPNGWGDRPGQNDDAVGDPRVHSLVPLDDGTGTLAPRVP